MKGSRRKGHDFERKIAQLFREAGFRSCITSREGDRSMDQKGKDLLHTFPYAIQLKCKKLYTNPSEIRNIECEEDEIPVVITKANNKEEMVILPLKNFLDLLHE